ncbi:thiamine-phosphate diphosphorylase [candidate division WOR-1 bacterium RIFOXYB2_FULL_42_35]|uniref:Thiamine-phosphate synthase n=1 Tax=candidate division WOR-1 bacterium RIFOXYC2_FULL_41_25 TaxID=1802586 RepID=A0A1F4TPN0_UNCSA|nr:MAG: thiamine-phosphate diphosphorylase [candidate division WOR-1 bacterium RIFOXYB2_FULL_42_35]OGC24626.1 MAG: thiamine-phosphate diphosphorylase [candidate division WOR-1 bacterium RIFOXYA2_FULL_41_14]OGC34671.1 MAG: thiamine-phosphate diphosphorylase [candidate division WOR-1 bacterium RIFOXYC2_FULL_41_25]OGC42098.1 MAG: thiamine-phosphate diphosphorylase [candidate division WOR-1 bacterium RIFOXYD2_FULL_41_8]
MATDLYPVITPELCAGRSPLIVLEETLKGGAKIVQLRAKENTKEYAPDFRKITQQYGALLIINDFVELALKYGADGVHLGLADLSIAAARRLAPALLIGASSHNLEEALTAQEAGADYVNIGPIFPTQTKNVVGQVVGVSAIKEISSQLKIPFTVMGGIKKSNINEVLAAGAGHIAMVTEITQAGDVKGITRELISAIRDWQDPVL